MGIKWIFFDIGNVLCYLDFESVWNAFLNECNASLEKVKNALYDDYLFNSFESGKIGPEDYYSGVKSILGCDISFNRFVEIWNSIIVKNDEMFNYIKRLRPHFKILILSNTNILNAKILNYDIKEIADRVVYSYQVGFMKPDPEIFRIALKYAKTSPENVLFVDDLTENIEAADSIGFKTYLFDNFNNFKKYMIDLTKLNNVS